MPGYAQDYSMRNNPVIAYNNGENQLSKWSKGEKIQKIKNIRKNLLIKSSWHHTSSFYNCTDFYSLKEKEDIEDILQECNFRLYSDKVVEEKEVIGTITYLEWSGTRNHPKADKHTYTGKFKIKGNWLIFGNKRKSITSNGTTFKIS